MAERKTLFQRSRLVVLALLLIVAPYAVSAYTLNVSTAILLAVPGALAFSLLTGVSGQISLGNAAFMGIGGTTAGLLGGQEHWPFLLVLVAAAVLSGLVGIIVGIASFRVRGLDLIIATLALQFVIQYAIQKIQTSTKAGVSGFLLPTATVGGWKAVSPKTWYFVLLGFAAVVTMIYINLVHRGSDEPGPLSGSVTSPPRSSASPLPATRSARSS